jgi:hypothetical protein
MLFVNLSIDALVCLECGEIVQPNELVVKKVAELDIPDAMKAKGALFSTVACPHCEQGFVFGFLAVPKKERKGELIRGDNSVVCTGEVRDAIPISDEEAAAVEQEAIEEQKQVQEDRRKKRKTGLVKSEDGTIDLDAPVERVPETLKKIQCFECKKEIEVPSTASSEFLE